MTVHGFEYVRRQSRLRFDQFVQNEPIYLSHVAFQNMREIEYWLCTILNHFKFVEGDAICTVFRAVVFRLVQWDVCKNAICSRIRRDPSLKNSFSERSSLHVEDIVDNTCTRSSGVLPLPAQ